MNVKSLRDTEGEPHLEMHPDDAYTRRITNGEMVRAFNQRGEMQLKVRVTDAARRGLVVAPSIWWKKLAPDHKNANELTSQRLTDMGRALLFMMYWLKSKNSPMHQRHPNEAMASQTSDHQLCVE